jgi:hypothetical protein
MLRVEGLEKTWPTSAGIKLGIGAEQRQITQPAVIGAGRFVIQQRATEGTLGAVIEQHPAFFLRKMLSPGFHFCPG